jgi:membrane-associated phospholipid phosphatase
MRPRFGSAPGLVLACVIIAMLGGCGGDSADDGGSTSAKAEPTAGDWKPWVLRSGADVSVPPPPRDGSAAARRDEQGLAAAVAKRTPAQEKAAREQAKDTVVEPWMSHAMEFVSERVKNPPVSSRAYGLVTIAMHDAAIAAWHWKYRYRREAPARDALVDRPPDPSYPSEYAAIAGAGSRVLEYLFPEAPKARLEIEAEDAAQARVLAGVSYPSDAAAGLQLGREVARKVIARARHDGSTRRWDGRRPRGRGYWEPPPGSIARPVEPLAGTWKTWILRDGKQLRPPPPPAFGSARFRREATELVRIGRNLTPEQKRIATFWAGGQGTPLPAGVWDQVMLAYVPDQKLSVPRQTRVFSLLNAAMDDAGIASWDAKYAYWNQRPITAIRALGIDPKWKPYIDTPFFPAYVSGHSTYSGAAGEVLAHLFPDDAKLWRQKAQEAGISRLYGGIHYRSDNVFGLRMGREIGRLAVKRAERDGAES